MSKAQILGKNIAKYRKSLHMTQAELAERIFVTPQNISKWENGYSLPDVPNLCLLADVLDISIDKLIGRVSDNICGNLMIGIDGGGFKTEFCLFDENGTVFRRKRLGGTNPNIYDINTILNTLKTGIDLLLDDYPDVVAIFAGIAGCSYSPDAEKILKFLKDQYPKMQLELKGNAVNAIYSTQYYNSCVVANAGTGSIIFAKNNDTMIRIGGWGYLLDKGYNGFYLGTEVLRAVMADEDGIGEATLLTAKLQKKLGGRAVDQIGMLYSQSIDEIASHTGILFEAFDEGDGVAYGIIEENIALFNKMLYDAIEKYPDCDKKIVITGGLTKRKDILLKFLESRDGAELIFPELPPIYGACHYCVRCFGEPHANFYENFKKSYEETSGNIKMLNIKSKGETS